MKKSEKIFLIALFSILTITVIIFAVIGLTSCKTAYADYNDLTGNEILNYNQLVYININSSNNENGLTYDNYSVNALSSLSSLNYFEINNISINANDTYYIHTNYVGDNIVFCNNTNQLWNIYERTMSRDSNIIFNKILLKNGNYTAGRYYFNLINLTQMFGSGNEPNLEQCQSLFTAEYYAYTESTPLTLNTFSGYEQALQDVFSSYKYALSMNALNYTSYAVAYNNASANFDYNTSSEQWYFENTFAVPLFTILNSGAQVTIDYWLYAPSLTGEWYLNVMLWNGNEYQTIYTAQEQIDTTEAQTMTFNLPLNADTLYFNVVYNNSINTSANFIVNKFNISASQLDINSMVHNAFISGQNDMARQYAPNGTKYLEIFNEGVRASQTNGAVFQDTWSFVGSAFTGIGGLLAVELIPNVPIGLFVAFPLLLGLIFFIVKVTKGGD